jgi:hypothetical protein
LEVHYHEVIAARMTIRVIVIRLPSMLQGLPLGILPLLLPTTTTRKNKEETTVTQ